MDSIDELKNNIDMFLKTRSTKEKDIIYADIQKNLGELEEISRAEKMSRLNGSGLQKELVEENIILKQKNAVLSRKIELLHKEKVDIENKVALMQKKRPSIPSEKLVTSFMDSMEGMNRELEKTSPRTRYQVNNMNVSLRTNLSLEDNAIKFQMPEADDIIPPENLSTIEFTIHSSPKAVDLSKYIEVPGVVGLMKEKAESIIMGAGLSIGEVRQVGSDLPQGSVLSQIPSAGSLTESDAVVDIVISRFIYGKVPNVVGLDLESASVVLTKSGFEPGDVNKRTDSSKEGTVISQSVEYGKEVGLGSLIDLTISENKSVEIPDVLGMKSKDAEKKLQSLNLNVGEVRSVESDKKPETVIKQGPRVGTLVNEGSSVNLNLAKKKESVDERIVPKVVNMNVFKARELLKSKGFRLGKITRNVNPGVRGQVLSQDPKPGAPINRKKTVDLVVSMPDKDIVSSSPSPRKVQNISGNISKIKK
ncbi:PASTA domain-containing protein [Methanococcoides sp. SA1]|nr:PASTA domain-containing protein [Methanococcoides sp. SA1]